MSEKKIRKSIRHFQGIEAELPQVRRSTAVIVSDSKGNYLKQHAQTSLERSIIWLGHSGLNSEEGINLLKSKLAELTRTYGRLSVYLFLGTCDITQKVGDFISLKQSYRSIRDEVIRLYTELADFAQSNSLDLTLLEIPIYSIKEWNKYYGDPCPEVFDRNDKQIYKSVIKVNNAIKSINSRLLKHSPSFSLDLENNRKPHGRNERYYFNYCLLKDGIHPSPLLAKLWLRRIAALIRQDCY